MGQPKESALRLNKYTTQVAVDSLPEEATLQSNHQGKILQADSRLCALTGYSPSEINNLLLFNLIPDLTGNLLRQWWDTLERQGHFEQQISLLRADEEMIPIYLSGYALEGSDHLYIRISNHQTATAQSQGEIDLLKMGIRHAKVALWKWNRETDVCTVSDTFFSLLHLDGKYTQTLNSKKFISIIKDSVGETEFLRWQQSLQDLELGQNTQLVLQHVATSQSVNWQAEPIFRGKDLIEIQGSIQDVTITDQELIQSQLAKRLVDGSNDLHIWIDQEGNIIFINNAACQELGYNQEECVNEISIFDIDVEDPREYYKKLSEEAGNGHVVKMVSSFQRKNGTILPVEVLVQQLAEGKFSLRAEDISRRRNQEAKIQSTLFEVESLSRQLAFENTYLQEEVYDQFEEIIGRSVAYQKVLKQVEQVAPTQATVLIEGETGTGKELLARAIHRLSSRKNRPIVKVNCAALPTNLIESELFGHERGAFTGADKRRIGRFEVADEGTLFLDEVGELPLAVQVKLLRILQEGEFERLGGNQTKQVNVRIIAATNRNLKEMIQEGTFREDLYYRLNVFPIHNTPLREREGDIPLLAQHFTKKFAKKLNKEILEIRQADMDKMMTYTYPGNIRELENIIERAVILSNDKILNLSSWKPSTVEKLAKEEEKEDFKSLEEVQIEQILKALKKTNWRVSGQSGAAQLLKINPQTLFSRMNKYGIKRGDD